MPLFLFYILMTRILTCGTLSLISDQILFVAMLGAFTRETFGRTCVSVMYVKKSPKDMQIEV